MKRRSFLSAAGLAAAPGMAAPSAARRPMLLANEFSVLRKSPDPARVQVYSPGLARLESGRLLATCDVSTASDMHVPGAQLEGGKTWVHEIYTSDDHGRRWTRRAAPPMMHARPFAAGRSVYVLGHANDLTIVRSTDGAVTWSEPARLSEGQFWHQAPCNVHYHAGRVYLVMERRTQGAINNWGVAVLAPVLMSAPVDADLTRRESWVFSNELTFDQAIEKAGRPHLIGTPFFPPGRTAPPGNRDSRTMAPIGWLESNVVQFRDPAHVWHDPAGRTFHLWMRAHTGTSNLACIAKAVESEDRQRITVGLESAPSGETMLYVPCPGGQMKFHILFDEQMSLFWLLSSQTTDSMTRPDRLPQDRYNLPNNERHRLALHFSKNCVDWCFAGMVAIGDSPRQARHYASMVIDGDDLHVLSRSGDHTAASAHDGNLITFHTVRSFRSLVY
jgi:hypothetical protein